MKRLLAGVAIAGLMAVQAMAGPVAEFESKLRSVYADYRMALFTTNSGKPEESAKAMETFSSKWASLASAYGDNPPPQYADDPEWKATLETVAAKASEASAQIGAGALPKAHEILEHVRDAMGGLHERNGIISFSDRMNAYHVMMEKVLTADVSKPDATAFDQVLESAAVLSYLSTELLKHPPQDAAGSEAYGKLAKALEASVAAFADAARARDAAKIKAAMAGLKPAYSKLFLKFG